MATLKANQQYDNTLIIFTSDNGASVYHGGSNWPLRGLKVSLHLVFLGSEILYNSVIRLSQRHGFLVYGSIDSPILHPRIDLVYLIINLLRHDNQTFQGTVWEGGTRVPTFVHAPKLLQKPKYINRRYVLDKYTIFRN